MEDAFEASGLSSILDFCFEFTGIHVIMLNNIGSKDQEY